MINILLHSSPSKFLCPHKISVRPRSHSGRVGVSHAQVEWKVDAGIEVEQSRPMTCTPRSRPMTCTLLQAKCHQRERPCMTGFHKQRWWALNGRMGPHLVGLVSWSSSVSALQNGLSRFRWTMSDVELPINCMR